MDEWKKNARRDIVIIDIDALVPKDHLLRKIEKVMDYDWLYEGLDPYYCHENGRPGTDPVVLIKMVLTQHCMEYLRCGKPTSGSKTHYPIGGFWDMGCWMRFRTLQR